MGEGRELARATSRHERGMRGTEMKDERTGSGIEIRLAKGNARIGGTKRISEGSIAKSNGLIHGSSGMESRACRVAWNQQPFSL